MSVESFAYGMQVLKDSMLMHQYNNLELHHYPSALDTENSDIRRNAGLPNH